MLSNRSSFKSLQTTHLDKNVSPSQNNYKYQHAHTSSTISNQNICIISDQYSKAKLLQLQEEISKLRKQMSQKQSFYHKQKGGLLNKLQILSSQNIQIKQRQSNLIKLNQTLQLAISTTNNSQSLTLTTKKLDQLRDQLNDKSRMLKQSKRSIQEYKKLIRVVQQQKYHIIQQKQKIIYQLNSKCKHMRGEKEQMISVLKNDIVNLPFKKEMINMIIQSLSCFNHQKHEFGPQDGSLYQNNNSQYLESPICKRRLPVELKGFKQSKFIDQSYSRFSGNSIINQLNKQQIASVYSQQNQQSQKLLCEVCKKVFQQQQFIIHMNQCNQIYQLHRKRSQLQKAIDELNIQQRKSLSQKKQVMAQRSNPLEQWDQNTDIDISRSKITSKNTNFNNRSILQVNQRKKVANRSQLFNNYTSNRLY